MTSDAFTAALQDLFSDLKHCLRLEKRFAMLTLAEKLTVLLSVVTIVIVMILLATQVIMYLMLALAAWVGNAVGSAAAGYLFAALLVAVLMCLFYVMRTRWVINPLARFMASLFDNTDL